MRRFPAEYVLLRHYLGEPVDAELEAQDRRLSAPHPGRARRLAAVPRRRLRHEREREGLFRAQDDRRRHRRAAHAARARGDPRARRRARRQRVHPRRCSRSSACCRGARVPVMPVEIMLLPRWFPFHLDKMSYWARTVIVPLLVLQALKPQARNPRGVDDRRAVPQPPQTVGPRAEGAASEMVLVPALPRHRRRAARGRAAVSAAVRASAPSTRRSPSSPSG